MTGSPVPVIATAGGQPGQIGILVDDLDAALAGFGAPAHVAPAWRIWTYGPAILREQTLRGEPAAFSMRLALGGAGPQLELIESLTGPSLYEEWRAEGRSGLHHVGFYVPDLRASIAEMEAAGYPLLMSGLGHGLDGTGGFAYFDTTAAIGYIVEAIEVPRERRPPEATWPGRGAT